MLASTSSWIYRPWNWVWKFPFPRTGFAPRNRLWKRYTILNYLHRVALESEQRLHCRNSPARLYPDSRGPADARPVLGQIDPETRSERIGPVSKNSGLQFPIQNPGHIWPQISLKATNPFHVGSICAIRYSGLWFIRIFHDFRIFYKSPLPKNVLERREVATKETKKLPVLCPNL